MAIESPLIQEFKEEFLREERQAAILGILHRRFGMVPEDLASRVRVLQDVELLRSLTLDAVDCADLDAFRAKLPAANGSSGHAG
jgi:hypothetical protein